MIGNRRHNLDIEPSIQIKGIMKGLSAIFICFTLVSTNCIASESSANESSIKQFITSMNGNKSTDYAVAFRDLDGDGQSEAIVRLSGDWCGSGGCNALILKRKKNGWNIVSKIMVTRTPIRVLDDVSHGWHSIGVWVQGGGILKGYEAELRFNGKSYPSNPSMIPANKSSNRTTGEVVIPD